MYFDGAVVQVENGALGVWHTNGLAAGQYSLRLRVVREDGNYAEYYALNLTLK